MAGLPLHELELLKRWSNHAELSRKLQELGLVSDLALLKSHVHQVGATWFQLGREHLAEAKGALRGGAVRTVYSRAYYAVYSFSKTIRFLVYGEVSMKGDDHKAVGHLPTDMPNANSWGRDLEALYDHRLRADYDNWSNTGTLHTLSPSDCVDKADAFHGVAQQYLLTKMEIHL